MHRGKEIRKGLARGLVAMLLLPVVLAIVLGLGGLLSALGDGVGAAICLRAGLVVGVLWLTSIVATVAGTAIAELSQNVPHRRRRHRRRRGRRSAIVGRPGRGAAALPPAESELRDRPA